jgi:hypothetical protein
VEWGIIMTKVQSSELITYVDSGDAEWQDFRLGSRRKVLYENPETGQLTMLVRWDAGYRMGAVEHHEYDEHLYIIEGTFVDEQRASGAGTYILNRAGSEHQAYTPDGCTFLEVVPWSAEPLNEVTCPAA